VVAVAWQPPLDQQQQDCPEDNGVDKDPINVSFAISIDVFVDNDVGAFSLGVETTVALHLL